MSNRTPSQNGHPDEGHSPSTDDLLTQREYASEIDVTPGYVSKRTKNGGLIDRTWSPSRDAVVDEEGNLLGYTVPTPRHNSDGGASTKSAQKAAGISSGVEEPRYGMGNRENGRPGRNSLDQSRTPGQNRSGDQSQSRDQSRRVDGLENVFGSVGRAVAEDRAARNTLFRVIGAVGGAILAAKLVGRRAGPVLAGTAIGAGLVEVSLQMEHDGLEPPNRTRGFRLPSRHNWLPPGMGQGTTFPITDKRTAYSISSQS
jgi:hypothetical protein